MTPESTALPECRRVERMEPPSGGPVRLVLDTDTYNEVDDQFALLYALLATEHMTLEAVHAAPFHNDRSTGPADGMEKSYDEILQVYERAGMENPPPVFKGSTQYLPAAEEPVDSPAARDLVERIRAMNDDEPPLYVAAIGAITNVASAILMEPLACNRIVVLWLGGHHFGFPQTREFNLKQDQHAARVIFNSGVPLVLVPCMGVAELIRTTPAELAEHLNGRGDIGTYLYEITHDYNKKGLKAWSKVIWDISVIAWLIDAAWIPSALKPSPILTSDCTWSFDPARHLIRVATWADRDRIFRDFFARVEARYGVKG